MKEERRYTGMRVTNGPEARVAVCKCKETHKTYGVRMERHGDGWHYTWAFPIKEAAAKREGYDSTEIKGEISPREDYNGCPFCGARYFVICGHCKHLNCNVGSGNVFSCDWCGNTGELGVYEGDGLISGGDIG